MINIRRLNEETWAFEEENVRFFLLTGKEKAVLIDSGQSCTNAKELVEGITDLPVDVLNTHADPDHIACNCQFEHVLMNPAEYANLYLKCNASQEMNLVSVYPENVIDLGDRSVFLLPLPGHTPGSIAIFDEKYHVLFGGDSIQSGNIYMFGPMRNMKAYELSLLDLQKRMLPFDVIYPSHGELPLKPDIITGLICDAQKIQNDEIVYEIREVHGQNVRAYKGECAVFLCDDK